MTAINQLIKETRWAFTTVPEGTIVTTALFGHKFARLVKKPGDAGGIKIAQQTIILEMLEQLRGKFPITYQTYDSDLNKIVEVTMDDEVTY